MSAQRLPYEVRRYRPNGRRSFGRPKKKNNKVKSFENETNKTCLSLEIVEKYKQNRALKNDELNSSHHRTALIIYYPCS